MIDGRSGYIENTNFNVSGHKLKWLSFIFHYTDLSNSIKTMIILYSEPVFAQCSLTIHKAKTGKQKTKISQQDAHALSLSIHSLPFT
jgi:hypothetical protein